MHNFLEEFVSHQNALSTNQTEDQRFESAEGSAQHNGALVVAFHPRKPSETSSNVQRFYHQERTRTPL